MYISENCNWTPYGTDPELDKLVDSNYWEDRYRAAKQGYGLDKLVFDRTDNYDDEEHYSIMTNVRRAVAEQGYGLDILINDAEDDVRRAVAKHNYGLDILINDENWWVRVAVAEQGYGLDKLVYDKNSDVCKKVQKYLIDNGYKSIFEWAEANPDRVVTNIDIDEWLNSDNTYKRAEVAKHGYGLDKFINDENWPVRAAVAEQGYGLNKLIRDEDCDVRAAVAKQGYGLDKLINDEDSVVRAAVAEQGYGLDKLINDEDSVVRAAVAEQGYGLDKLINDEDSVVRAAVAEQGYGLNRLINDKDDWVRYTVAEQGYGLDKLVNDEWWEVRETVKYYLLDEGYSSISDWAKKNPRKVYYRKDKDTGIIDTNFIYKVNDSNKLKVETDYSSIEDFFDDYYLDEGTLTILTADTKIPLIKLEKTTKDGKNCYKFLVNITNEYDDNFTIKSILSSKAKFNQLLESTINALQEYPQFSKYADDLENCL